MDKEVYRCHRPRDLTVGSPSGVLDFGVQRSLGKVSGTATIIERPYELHQVNLLRRWLWQGLPLKTEGTAGPGPKLTLTATKIELSTSLPERLFVVPKGYAVTDFPVQPEPDGTGNQ